MKKTNYGIKVNKFYQGEKKTFSIKIFLVLLEMKLNERY